MAKRPMSPAAAGLLMFGGTLFVGGTVLSFLTKNMAALQRGMEGLGTLSLVLAIGAYLAQRSKVKKWNAASPEAGQAPPSRPRPKPGDRA